MFQSKYPQDSAQSPGFLFIKVYNQWYAAIQKALRVIDLTHPQFVILTVAAYLQHQGQNPTQKTIADHAAMDVMTTSQVLRLLEKKQYIQRTPHPADSRANRIAVLPVGQEKVNQGVPLIENIDDQYFGDLQADLPEFMRCLRKLYACGSNGQENDF